MFGCARLRSASLLGLNARATTLGRPLVASSCRCPRRCEMFGCMRLWSAALPSRYTSGSKNGPPGMDHLRFRFGTSRFRICTSKFRICNSMSQKWSSGPKNGPSAVPKMDHLRFQKWTTCGSKIEPQVPKLNRRRSHPSLPKALLDDRVRSAVLDCARLRSAAIGCAALSERTRCTMGRPLVAASRRCPGRSLAFGCARLRSAALACACLRSPALACAWLRSPALSCAQLRSPALSCARLRSPALSCARLRSAALGCARRRSAALGGARLRSAALGCARRRSAALGGARRRCPV
jgi:uncharacterized protein YjbI with pentapeptide repeats